MAQLSDDCFASGSPLMSIDEAVGIITTRVAPMPQGAGTVFIQEDERIDNGRVILPPSEGWRQCPSCGGKILLTATWR